MSQHDMPADGGHIYRVDKFVVPAKARDEFVAAIRNTHEVLRAQAGFVRDAVLEQVDGPGEFNMVTIAEWESTEAIERARAAVLAMHARTGFDARALLVRLGIQVDLAYYQSIGV